MSAFFLFDNLEVRDAQLLQDYVAKVAPMVVEYGGRYRALGGPTEMLEGEWSLTYPVMIEFDTVAAARRWYGSEDYAPMKRLRQSAVRCNGVLIEGLEGT